MPVSPAALTWLLGGVSLALLAFLAYRFYRAALSEDDRMPLRIGGGVRRLALPEAPTVLLEIDPGWPRRTRLRIPAPAPLSLPGPARLAPRGLRPGRDLSPAFTDLVWTGRGADAASSWSQQLLEEPLRALWGWRDRYSLQATLTPFGLLIHMPLVAADPNEEPFLLEQARRLYQALAHIAGQEAEDGMAMEAPLAEPQAECSTCWEPVGAADAAHCPACGGRQHADCAEWTGGCGRFACDGVDKLEHSLRSARG